MISSLPWLISLSFCSFAYNGVYYDRFKLSISEVIVKKVPMEMESCARVKKLLSAPENVA